MKRNIITTNWILAIFIGVLLFGFSASVVFADSPPNIATDIAWSAGTSSVTDIETAFNNARRQEETQLGIGANTIGTLDLPTQAVWDGMTDDAKALYIINDERVDRAGMQAGVIGLPLTAILPELDDLAQYYADFLLANNATGITQMDNRLSTALTIGPWLIVATNLWHAERISRIFGNHRELLHSR